jgi:hypothetical protein
MREQQPGETRQRDAGSDARQNIDHSVEIHA